MKVKDGQNIFDICLQEFGDLELIWSEIVIPNKLTINSNLEAGLELNLNTFNKGNQRIKEYYKVNNISVNNQTIDEGTPEVTYLAIQWPVYIDLLEPINIHKAIQV